MLVAHFGMPSLWSRTVKGIERAESCDIGGEVGNVVVRIVQAPKLEDWVQR